MLKKYSLSVLLVTITFLSFAQKELFFPKMDSIPISYRSEGVPLDSVDALVTKQPNLRPGGGFGIIYETQLADYLFKTPAGFSYLANQKRVTPKFTGLPYLGFQYAFGSSLTQDLNVEYHHFFRENTHLHLNYNRRSSNGFLRNGKYQLNDLGLRFYHSKGIYTLNLDGYYGHHSLNQNFGIETDTLIKQFGLKFTPVNQNDGESKIRNLDLKIDNLFKLVGDSSIQFGLKTRHRLQLINRTFTERLMDPSIYDTLYVDTTGNTRDQYQTSQIATGAGIYFNSPYFKIDATVNHNYWRNQNLGIGRDTNEVYVHSNLWAGFGQNMALHNEFSFNFIGAIGEIKDYFKFYYRILDNLTLTAKLNFENVYPEPYLRFHQANYYQWNIDNLKMQQKLQVGGSIRYGRTNYVEADVLWTSVNNGRYFINQEWRQDTLEFVTVGSVNVKGAYHIKQWGFYPNITIRFNSKNFNYQPIFSTLNRFTFSTKVFKQKLGLSTGIDVGYQTGYQFMLYEPVFDLLSPTQSVIKNKGWMQLNAFFALSIDQFRFFVKAENLSYFWQDKTTRIDENYPVAPFIIRIGITWDFFN